MKKIKELLLQSFLIFLSVFLGIVASNWNEERRETKKTKSFLVNLTKEIKSNKKSIEKSIPYHKKIGEVYDSLYANMDKKTVQMDMVEFGGLHALPGWDGLRVASIEQSVYKSGMSVGVFENVSMELLTKIARVNSIENEYIRFYRSVSDKLLNYTADTKVLDYYVVLQILGKDLLYMENGMIKAYENLIKEIEEESSR
ncbi:MAG: hypothetical protein AAFZ15_32220 [Bacteroidota bacterium]